MKNSTEYKYSLTTEKQPIRIAQVIGKWLGGGVEAVVMNYYRHIDRNKIQFDFICDSDSTNIPYEEIEKLGGRVILVPPYQKVFAYHKELKRIFKENNYKIVHSHINTLSVFPLYAAKCAGVPIRIAHNHATTNKKELKRHIIKTILKPFNKLYANEYACCSEYAGKWMFGNNNYNKVTKINNAIDIDKFGFDKKVRDSYRKRLGIKNNQLVIGHVGRMVETKNHTFLLDVFKKVCENYDSILLLIGQGPLLDELKEKAKNLGIDDKVIFLGQREDINNWYQVFDVFVLPSLYEGFGLALLEAQASNLPCIVSANIPREVKLTNNFEFIMLNDSLEQWNNSILAMYKNSSRKSNNKLLSENGFDITKESEKLTEYYFKLIDEVSYAND